MAFTKGGKSVSPEAILGEIFFFLKICFSIIYVKDIKFESAGLLKIVLIVTPLVIYEFNQGIINLSF